MSIEPLSALGALTSGMQPGPRTQAPSQIDFGRWMLQQLSELNEQVAVAERSLAGLAVGEGNLHQAMLDLEKARTAMQLTVQVRNKLMEGYQETYACRSEAPTFRRYVIPTEGFPTLGPADAPITIVDFSDYQCPFCRRWHEQVYEPLLAAYPGKIRMVYRNLPLTSIHPDAQPAAEAALCAGEQDAYWDFHNKLFSSDSLGAETLLQYAQELGLDMGQFQTCVTDRKYKDAVEKDSEFAVYLGVRSTPTFFINGLAIVGAQPLEVFQQVIDKELAGEIPE